jgi:sugar phosphate isomerase/epimerase
MKLGIGTYTYAWSIGAPGYQPERPLNALDLLGLASALGVRVVQYGPNLPIDELPQDELQQLMRRARARDIEIEIGTRGIDPEYLARQIELAKQVRSATLRWSVDDGSPVEVPIDTVEDCMRRVLPHLERAQVRLAMDNSRIPSVCIAGMLQRLNSPWVGVTLDTVNSLAIPEGPASLIENLAPYVASLHIKDYQISRMPHRMGFIVEGRPAGAGQLDVPGLIAALRALRVKANAILELWPPEQSSISETVALEHRWAAESIAYLRRYILN